MFHPLVIPGLLQTEEYIRAVFTSGTLPQPEVDARVAARLARAEILQQPGRRFTFVLTAGALGWRVGGPEVMVRQVEHTAVVGVIGGSAYYNDPADVARYVTTLAALEQLAVLGDEARAELRHIADKYRDLT